MFTGDVRFLEQFLDVIGARLKVLLSWLREFAPFDERPDVVWATR